MKFFMEALGNNEEEKELNYEFIDCCLGSALIIISFLETLEVDWKLSSSRTLNCVKAIIDMVDFRKANNFELLYSYGSIVTKGKGKLTEEEKCRVYKESRPGNIDNKRQLGNN